MASVSASADTDRRSGCGYCQLGDENDAEAITATLKRCTACYAVRYCNKYCQGKHWFYHKDTCAALPKSLRGVRFTPLPYGADVTKESNLCTEGAGRDGQYVYPHAAAQLSTFLASVGKVIRLDDMLFCQLVTTAFEHHDGDHDLVLDTGTLSCLLRTTCCYDATASAPIQRTVRLEPISTEHKQLTHDAAVHFRMYDCPMLLMVGPDAKGRYVSLSQEGPERRTPEEWYNVYMDAALECLHFALVDNDKEWIDKVHRITDLTFEDWHVRSE